jgi:hypothetical protein
VGGADIPGFDIELMRALAACVGEGDDFRKVMACHHSPCGEQTACVGYVAVEGISNLNVRIMAAMGDVDYRAIVDACEGLDLWPSFASMLAAYEIGRAFTPSKGAM